MDDERLRADILEELDHEPGIDPARIDVAVTDGIVTLRGGVRSLREKDAARGIVEEMLGVRGLIDRLAVRPPERLTDDEIARRVAATLEWHSAVPAAGLAVSVAHGRVTLAGTVAWHHQAEAAVQALRQLDGVIDVADRIAVQPPVQAGDVADRIRRALLRCAEIDAARIRVHVADGTVTLEGRVRSLGERRSAERAAWSAPGVCRVVDRLDVL